MNELSTRLHLYLDMKDGETEEQAKERLETMLQKFCEENPDIEYQIYESQIEEI